MAVPDYALTCVVKNVPNRGDHRLRLIELDVFRTVAGEYLFVRRQCQPMRLLD